jgi:addiction module RelB/DinJ family antitoxin
MPASTATSIRLDPKIKKDAQVLAKKMGTNLSGVVNMYLAQFVREKRLNISVYDEEGFDLETQKRIMSALAQPFDEKEDMVFGSADELIAHLKKMPMAEK